MSSKQLELLFLLSILMLVGMGFFTLGPAATSLADPVMSLLGTARIFLPFGAGIFSLFTPCGFALLPGYVAYRLQAGDRGGTNVAIFGLGASLGLLSFFGVVGLLVAFVGSVILAYVPIAGYGAALLVAILGVSIIIGRPVDAGGLFRKLASTHQATGTYMFGIIYGVTTSSCSAPIFFAIVLSAAVAGFPAGLFMLLSYAVGMVATLTLVTGLVVAAKRSIIKKIAIATPVLHKLAGGLLIIVGLYIVYVLIT